MIKNRIKKLFPCLIVYIALVAWLSGSLLAADLRLVVIGDTSPEFFSRKSPFFKEMIEKINELQPDAVIHLGDMIAGYGFRRLRSQWDEFDELVSKIKAPFFRIPGNHDIYSQKSLETYLQRYGQTYYSVDINGYHLIFLWNVEENRLGHISRQQFNWLKSDLKDSERWRGAFIFLHVPVWTKTSKYVLQIDKDFWQNKIHPLLVQNKVLAVFAGHYHRFGPMKEMDGIKYYISGGGGPRINNLYVSHGGANHFLLVEATGRKFEVMVVYRDRIVSDEEADVLKDVLK
ncbi:MAG TPA: metallophosphoesterase [Candidatus Saccharicenans sp.]|nr:metallophosphoesterase [Candidatus Saccharicenans sp.]HQO76750.1 metallophosphoesterase [Candidatus Saccharicenans sp.]